MIRKVSYRAQTCAHANDIKESAIANSYTYLVFKNFPGDREKQVSRGVEAPVAAPIKKVTRRVCTGGV